MRKRDDAKCVCEREREEKPGQLKSNGGAKWPLGSLREKQRYTDAKHTGLIQ